MTTKTTYTPEQLQRAITLAETTRQEHMETEVLLQALGDELAQADVDAAIRDTETARRRRDSYRKQISDLEARREDLLQREAHLDSQREVISTAVRRQQFDKVMTQVAGVNEEIEQAKARVLRVAEEALRTGHQYREASSRASVFRRDFSPLWDEFGEGERPHTPSLEWGMERIGPGSDESYGGAYVADIHLALARLPQARRGSGRPHRPLSDLSRQASLAGVDLKADPDKGPQP